MMDYLEAAVTFTVGLVALLVYQKQKRDYKKDAANILLIEIEAAERQLQTIKQAGTPTSLQENIFLMPLASWQKYRHLFARVFTPREWDIITEFYARCKQFDESVVYDSSFFRKNEEAWRLSINNVLAQAAYDAVKAGITSDEDIDPDSLYKSVGQSVRNIYMDPANLYSYSPQKTLTDALNAIGGLDGNISTGTIGIKLRRVARASWIQRSFTRQTP